MAFQSTWYFSQLPKKVIDLIETEISEDSTLSDDHWMCGFVWHYILKANRENFLYKLSGFDGESIKFKKYNEGDFQSWHVDQKPVDGDEEVRKLSFTIQLSDYDEYEGGNVQLMDEVGGRYYLPRQRGVVAIFDSQSTHRVQKVTKGTRKSLVGWCVGPQWS